MLQGACQIPEIHGVKCAKHSRGHVLMFKDRHEADAFTLSVRKRVQYKTGRTIRRARLYQVLRFPFMSIAVCPNSTFGRLKSKNLAVK